MDAAVKLPSRHLPDIHIQSCLLTHEMLAYAPIKPCIYTTPEPITTASPRHLEVKYQSTTVSTAPPPNNSFNRLQPYIHQAVIIHPQEESTDCGVFAIAYAFELALGNDPSLFVFDQSKMREHLLTCFENRYVSLFPKSRRNLTPSKSINITRGVSPTQKWSTPKKPAPPRQQPMHTTPIQTGNRFATLSPYNSNKSANNNTVSNTIETSTSEEMVSFLDPTEMNLLIPPNPSPPPQTNMTNRIEGKSNKATHGATTEETQNIPAPTVNPVIFHANLSRILSMRPPHLF